MALQAESPMRPASDPPGPRPAAAPRRRPARRLLRARTTPEKLRLLIVALVALCLAWGALAAWAVSRYSSAASDVVGTSEPASLTAQQMYQSLSDADVTVATAFLSGPYVPLKLRQRYTADIAQAGVDLTDLKSAAATGANPQPTAALSAVSSALPAYAGYVAQAQTYNALGFPLTGGSFMQVASEEMHLTLLPAAANVYAQANARLDAASSAATGLPPAVAVVVLAVLIGYVLVRAQRWLLRRTHRVFNFGLVAASALTVAALVWLVVAFAVARSDLHRAVGHGSRPAEALAQADIEAQHGRGDEILNLISRSGSTFFTQNFRSVRNQLDALLSTAAASAGGDGARWVAAAVNDARGFYASNDKVFQLDLAANYATETQLVIGSAPADAGAQFDRLEGDIGRAIAADQAVFRASAPVGRDAFTGLEAGVIVASLAMAAGCGWGLTRRLVEYR